MRTQLIKAGLTALAISGLFILPMPEAEAITKCREIIENGRVVRRFCTTDDDRPRRKMVCDTYWRRGVEHRDCRRVGPPPRDWEDRGPGSRHGDWGRGDRRYRGSSEGGRSGDWDRDNW